VDILDQLNLATEELLDGCRWPSGALLAEVSASHDGTESKDFIYEFDCLTRIIEDLHQHQRVEFIEGFGENRYCFPKSPGNKALWPRFLVRDRITDAPLMQVCVGTKISILLNDRYRAPDISFQVPMADLSPSKVDVLLIYDCKYNEGSKRKHGLSLNQFSYFSQMVRDLDLTTSKRSYPFVYQSLKGLEGNAILTNGDRYSDDHDYHVHNHLKIVYHFDSGKTFGVIG
jgi:hypothetical protein